MIVRVTTRSLPADFETYAEARGRRAHDIEVLQRGDRHQRQLAKELNGCRKGHRCQTEACKICLALFRRWLVREATPILASRPPWTSASVVTAGLLALDDELNDFDLNKLVKRFRKRLERSSLADRLIVGGVDVSHNVQENCAIGYQFHLYLLIEGQDSLSLREAVKAAFPPDDAAAEPYRFKCVNNIPGAVSYTYKSIFIRRSRFIDASGVARTKKQPLKGAELRALLTFLASYKVGARLILQGVRRNGNYLVRSSGAIRP
jgi:hypothetical protein